MQCPSCGETNSTEMAFCIYCGAPLKVSADPMEVKPSIATAAPRPCANCGQTDSLNRQFCIFCGSRVDGRPPSFAQPVPAVTSSVDGSRTAETRLARARMLGLVACVAGGILGVALGLGMSWYRNESSPPPTATRSLPSKGLVILTAVPYATFQVISDGRRYLTGKTGKDGDIVLQNIDPNNYKITVTAPGHAPWTQTVQVKGNGPTVLGETTEIFAQ